MPARPAPNDDLLVRLGDVVDPTNVLVDPELRLPFERDATGRFGGPCRAVVRPRTRDEVAAVLALCHRAGVPVVPQGGNTGLAGGGVPSDRREVVLSLSRLVEIAAVDTVSREITVGAGITLEEVQQAARGAGLEFPLDFGARSKATVGGMVATNAAGPTAYRWGPMRSQVAGLEAVQSDGTVLSRLAGPPKDNAGYDWPAVVIGSEGTLAVVTAARLRLRRPPKERIAAVVGAPDLDTAVETLEALDAGVADLLEAVDFVDGSVYRLIRTHRGLSDLFPTPYGAYLVLTLAGEGNLAERLLDALPGERAESTVAAEDVRGREQLWAYRELANEAARAQGVVHKFDVSLPIREIPRFAREVAARIDSFDPEAVSMVYGHLGDGNVHVNVIEPAGSPEALSGLVLSLVADLGGSVDAEHGIGVAKRRYLSLTRTPAELEAMRAIKNAFDPGWLLNPGRVLDVPPSIDV